MHQQLVYALHFSKLSLNICMQFYGVLKMIVVCIIIVVKIYFVTMSISLVPRPYRYRWTAWYTLFAHAFNLSNIRVKCRYSSILLRAIIMITWIDDEKLPNPGSHPVETHDDIVCGLWCMLVLDIVSLTLLSRLEFLNNLRSITEKMFLYCYPCWKRLCY